MATSKQATAFVSGESGQAATEFLVTAVFVLLPLFFLIPLVGKYIDIKQAAIQQARYEAWEYTAWFGPREHIKSGIKDSQRAARKPWDIAREEGNELFFTDITDRNYGIIGYRGAINPLWKDHHGRSLFVDDGPVKARGLQREEETPDPSRILGGESLVDDLLSSISWVLGKFGDLLHLVGVKAKFDAIYTKGYFTSRVNVQVRSPAQVVPVMSLNSKEGKKADPLTLHARAAVLSNCWNAGSGENAQQESRGLVVTSLLAPIFDPINKIIDGVSSVMKHIPFIRFSPPHVPQFGYVAEGLVPYDDLEKLPGSKKKHAQRSPYDKHEYTLKNYKGSLYSYEQQD